jgi:valyl-tRNA synthetase
MSEKSSEKFQSPYDPNVTEERIYELWEKSGFFNPDNLPNERPEPYNIVLPPPNVTGILHMGSALMLVVEDILIRHARMSGKRTLWLPGTDSAAIATQAKVEKEIQKREKKNRHDLGREELLRRIDVFIEDNKTAILKQVRALGASLDWSRYAYTMDSERYNAVMTAFMRMHKAGLIYRGNRIVNWDPKGQTVISDEEVEHEEKAGILYTFKYWNDFPIAVSTTRPETKVGDTAVAVHPSDTRYKKFVGKEFTGEFAGTTLTIKIIADVSVEKEFGTGALGVTPAHSQTDDEIAQRHSLKSIQVIDEKARMTRASGSLVTGLKTLEAREKIVAWLRSQNLLEKEEQITQNISIAQRTGGVVEPLPKLQWFVAVNKEFTISHSEIPGIQSGTTTTLKEIMRKGVECGEIKIVPEHFAKVYFHWVDNLRDWCISRQIWFGHRIPVWYHEPKCIPIEGREDEVSKCEEIIVSSEEPKCKHCAAKFIQDPDVLDTWFSSSLWTFSTLGWPNDTKDLHTYHPTTVLETGYDILPFWVARMILMSGFHLGQVPFKTVYLHGLVRDEQNRKISKSLGNNIDPLEMGTKYGTDAVRMSLIIGTTPGADSKISENKIKAYKHFSNKLWNVTRYILENTDGEYDTEFPVFSAKDTKLVTDLNTLTKEVTLDIENHRLYLAGEKLYHYVWHELADIVLEESKVIFQSANDAEIASRKQLLLHILYTILKLLHPFMPFITEEVWQSIPHKNEKPLLMIEKWPV